MPDFGLPQRTLDTMHAIFARYPKVEKVVVYGSRAMGNNKTGSDIDLTMYGEYTDSISYDDLSEIAGALDDSDIPYMVDLSIFDQLENAKLREHIERVGVVFYKAEKWETKKLEVLCTFIRGLTYSKKDEVQESNNRVLRATNIDLETHTLRFDDVRFINDAIKIKKEKKVKKNDILICTASGSKSHLGKVALVDSEIDFAFGGFMAVIRGNDEILPQYLFKVLISQGFKNHLSRLSDGANINNLKFDLIKNFLIPLPPLPIQKQIVEKLDAAFVDIDKAMTATQKNIDNAEALFQQYLKMIFQTESTDWKKEALGDVTHTITKGSSPKWQGINYVTEPRTMFITSENVGERSLIFKKTKYVEDKFNEKDKKSILRYGDVLTNIVGASIGRTALFDLHEKANINQAVCLIRCDKKYLNNMFLVNLLNSPKYKQILHQNETSMARANLSLTFFSELSIPIPSLSAQEKINALIDKFRKKQNKLDSIYHEKKKNLEALKSSILNQAFSGELTKEAA